MHTYKEETRDFKAFTQRVVKTLVVKTLVVKTLYKQETRQHDLSTKGKCLERKCQS